MRIYIPLISRVGGPYGKLWTEFCLPFMVQDRSARAMKIRKENSVIILGKGRFDRCSREVEVRTATYGPEVDQSQRTKSGSHIISSDSGSYIFHVGLAWVR